MHPIQRKEDGHAFKAYQRPLQTYLTDDALGYNPRVRIPGPKKPQRASNLVSKSLPSLGDAMRSAQQYNFEHERYHGTAQDRIPPSPTVQMLYSSTQFRSPNTTSANSDFSFRPNYDDPDYTSVRSDSDYRANNYPLYSQGRGQAEWSRDSSYDMFSNAGSRSFESRNYAYVARSPPSSHAPQDSFDDLPPPLPPLASGHPPTQYEHSDANSWLSKRLDDVINELDRSTWSAPPDVNNRCDENVILRSLSVIIDSFIFQCCS